MTTTACDDQLSPELKHGQRVRLPDGVIARVIGVNDDGTYTVANPVSPDLDSTYPVTYQRHELEPAHPTARFIPGYCGNPQCQKPMAQRADRLPAICPDCEITNDLEKPMSNKANDILLAAAGHMADRAATYDKPQGERSMASTVSAFRATTGITLTEEQGWHFMCLLKLVRSQQGDYRADNYEDLAAYAALTGEAAAKGD